MYVCLCVYIYIYIHLVAFIREHVWHKLLLMRYLMKLELTRVCSLNSFYLRFFFCFYECWSFFLDCVSLRPFYPSYF